MNRVSLRGHVLCKRQETRTGSAGGEGNCVLLASCMVPRMGYVSDELPASRDYMTGNLNQDSVSGKPLALSAYDHVIEFLREFNLLMFYPPHVVPRT